jgi:hypothetical protein
MPPDENERLKNEIVTAASAVVGREATHLLSDDFVEVPLSEAITALMPRLGVLAIAIKSKWAQARARAWQQRVYSEYGDDPARVKEEIYRRLLKDPRAARAIVDSYDALLEAEDAAVVPTLAALAAYYSKNGGPNVFFRRFARFLKELSAPMFGMTMRLFDALSRAQTVGAGLLVVKVTQPNAETLVSTGPGDNSYDIVLDRWPESDYGLAIDVIEVLKQHRVQWMNGLGSDDPELLMVHARTVSHVRMLMREPIDEVVDFVD